MKHLFLLLLCLGFISPIVAQKRSFKDAGQYGEWIMGYQENPEPTKLYAAFEYGVSNEEIAEGGQRRLILAFFGSIFRNDSTQIQLFYDQLKKKSTVNKHYGFIGSLWSANTPYSKMIWSQYMETDLAKQYEKKNSFTKPPFDIYKDSITDPSHLDILWADFFATGNSASVQRIISVLNYTGPVPEAAQWSLTSNGLHYKKVKQIILDERKNTENTKIKKKLNEILSDISKADVR